MPFARAGNKTIKYFLATIEHYVRWLDEGGNGTPKVREKDRLLDLHKLTVEHVYPQSPDAADRDLECDQLVNSLGNLTILGTGDNDAVGNKGFADKSTVLARSTIELNKKIASKALWTTPEIEARANMLVSAAKKVFN